MLKKYTLLIGLVTLTLVACGGNVETPTSAPMDTVAPTIPIITQDDDGESPTPVPAAPAIVDVHYNQPPESIDPVVVAPRDAAGSDLVENLFIGLTRLDPDSGEVYPALAREWEVSDNGLTWTVYLRDDVNWVRIDANSGQVDIVRAVTAADVVYSIRRACTAENHAPLAQAVFVIRGCREIYQTGLDAVTNDGVAGQLGVRVLNDVAVEFRLIEAGGMFPSIMAMPIMRPLPADLITQAGEDWTNSNTLWTSGPYTVQPTIPANEGYTLIANLHWHLEKSGNVDAVQVTFGEGGFEAWQSGDVDVSALPRTAVGEVSFEDDPRFRRLAQPASTFIAFSYDTPPFDNADVRRALSLGLDREAIINLLAEEGEVGIPALTITPPGMASVSRYGDVGVRSDASAAQAALTAAGYPECEFFPPVTLLTDDSILSVKLADAYVDSWRQALGCLEANFVIDPQPIGNVLTTMREQPSGRSEGRPGMITLGWQADIYDAHHWLADIIGCRELFPDAFLDQARSCGAADTNLESGSSLIDSAGRVQLYGQIDAMLFNPTGEMPVIPVYFHARALAIQPWMEVYPIRAGALQFDRWVVDLESRE